jgi:hypothetical protein
MLGRDVPAPVVCGSVGYNKVAENQNVIAFRDDGWPHKQAKEDLLPDGRSPIIALTTVTYNTDTGEIFDADMELNSADHKIVPLLVTDTLDGDTFDLESVVTHEIGHMFGIAHAPSKASVMFANDEGHDLRKRTIGLSDIMAICAVYPPDGAPAVDVVVDPSGRVPGTACDPTPRHGFTSDCQSDPPQRGCSSAPVEGGGGGRGGGGALVVAAAALGYFRSRRRCARRSAAVS